MCCTSSNLYAWNEKNSERKFKKDGKSIPDNFQSDQALRREHIFAAACITEKHVRSWHINRRKTLPLHLTTSNGSTVFGSVIIEFQTFCRNNKTTSKHNQSENIGY